MHHLLTVLFTNLHMNSEVQKPAQVFVPHCHQSSKLTSQETELCFYEFKTAGFVICDWWISIHFMCFCVSGFVACDRNKKQLPLQQWKMHFYIVSCLLNSRVCLLLESVVTTMLLLSLRWITPLKLFSIPTHWESTSFYKMLPNWTWEYIVLTVCSVLVHWGLIIFFELSKDIIIANYCTCTCKYRSLCLP